MISPSLIRPPGIQSISQKGFTEEIKALGKSARNAIGKADLNHLKRIIRAGNLLTLLGYATAWIFPNPFSALLIAEGNMARWCIVAHHLVHKGYDRVENAPKRFLSRYFAAGWRRWIDWPDLILPEAWHYEHNIRHHFFTGETADPDVAEETLRFLRTSRMPKFFKYSIILFFACTWKWTYYAPNTLRELRTKEPSKINFHIELWAKCYLPYILFRFIFIPACFLFVGWQAALFVVINSVLAEIITNVHTFLIIVPNHTGNDLYRFSHPVANKDEFYIRQIAGSTNYTTGNDWNDFLHGWLN